MPFWRRKPKEPSHEEEFQQNQALAEQQLPLMEDDMRSSLGRSIYMVHDPYVHDVLMNEEKNPLLNALLPAFSFLNRTTNIDEREKRLLELQYEYIGILADLTMREDAYENRGWLQQEAFKIYATFLLNDAKMGWKGRLVTEQIRKIITELKSSTQKKRRFF